MASHYADSVSLRAHNMDSQYLILLLTLGIMMEVILLYHYYYTGSKTEGIGFSI